jgi:putative ABC transport system substrate-binding protein
MLPHPSLGQQMHFDRLKRREFITLLGGAAAAWPLAARAQQRERMRRVGVLMDLAADDPEGQARLTGFLQTMQQLGWTDRRNVRIDIRWTAGDAERIRKHAAELVALSPDVLVTVGSSHAGPLQQATRIVPIVFASVADPVGGGFVTSLSRPGGNATGFTPYDYSMGGKWMELLKEIAPVSKRAAILRDPVAASGIGHFAAIQAMGPALGLEVIPVSAREADEIERAMASYAGAPNGGLIVLSSALAFVHREQIIALAAQYRLPAVYSDRVFVSSGGLLSYAPDTIDAFRRVAGYVDRILKGEKPANLPVQAPTKYELVINLKTAKALGLTVPDTLLARADEVIE